jgi:radical SAM-linked protein
MRLRIAFAKTEAMRFTSHLDLHRTWERTLRRAGIPLAYSQGFNPHPRINLACALPLGFTSQAELVDIWLETDQPLDAFQAALERAAPPGIRIQEVQAIDERLPALQTQVEACEYLASLPQLPEDLPGRVQALLESPQLLRNWRGKPYDLRPLIHALLLEPGEAGPRLRMTLSTRDGATGRPDEVLSALGVEPATARVHRTRTIFHGTI